MALVSKYNGFIFDYGGVLVSHQTDADQAAMAKMLGIDVERFTELYWADRAEYDSDILSGAEYWSGLARKAGVVINDKQLIELIDADCASWMRFDEVMWEWIGQLRGAGKRVAMLSNMPRDLGEALRSRTSRLEEFDAVILSYEVRAAKPEPAIYDACLEKLDLPATELLFFDDRIANVQGAEMLGIDSIEFLDRDDVLLRVRS